MRSSRPPPPENPLDPLIGKEVPSEVTPGVSYRPVWQLGEGGMSVVFYALRVSAQGEIPVVIKMLKPAFVAKAGPTAALIIKKEAIALGRLNERVPPTPFVVRFIDTGTHPVAYGGAVVEVPWVVVEYVHGGAEGTTLSERVDHSLQTTGAAFDPHRAAHAIECLTGGLSAVHEVGVIHRDLKPDNVLCCGFGDDEIFKLADFGVARPAGIGATFTGAVVGTPGFVAPELTTGDPRAIGTWSDVFSQAAVFFFLLTGEEYFTARTPVEALTQAIAPTRRSILDTKGLSPELRAREQACRSIDFALSCATAARIESRPRRADAFAAMLLPWLRVESVRASLLVRRLEALRADERTRVALWHWNTMRAPSAGQDGGDLHAGLAIRGVAWDGDGRAMAATSRGLAFWNGASWTEVSTDKLPDPTGIRFVQRVGAGRWLVGGDSATFATYTTEGVSDVRRLSSSPIARFDQMSGDLDDLAVLVGQSPAGPPPSAPSAAGAGSSPSPCPTCPRSRRSPASTTPTGSWPGAAPTGAASRRSTRRSTGRSSASRAPACAPTWPAPARSIARSASSPAPRARWSSAPASGSRTSWWRADTTSRPPPSTRWAGPGRPAPAASGCAARARRGPRRGGTSSGRTRAGRCPSSRSSPTWARWWR